MKLFESEKTLAFLDIGPLSKGHAVRQSRANPARPLLESYLGMKAPSLTDLRSLVARHSQAPRRQAH